MLLFPNIKQKESRMRVWNQSTARTIANRLMIIAIIPSGLWWLLWMVIWGYNFHSFFEGIEFTLFFIAEVSKYLLYLYYIALPYLIMVYLFSSTFYNNNYHPVHQLYLGSSIPFQFLESSTVRTIHSFIHSSSSSPPYYSHLIPSYFSSSLFLHSKT